MNWKLIVLVASIVAFLGATLAVREAGNWAWLVPAGLACFAAAHLPSK